QLDPTLFLECINDPQRHEQIAPVVRYFGDIDAAPLLAQVASEKNPARSRLLMSIIALHGPAVFPLVLEQLPASAPHGRATLLTTNLLQLIPRAGVPAEADRRQ